MRTRPKGYIFFETMVALAVLSVSAVVIQGAMRQAIAARGLAQDYTDARFLLEKIAAEHALRFQQPEGSGSGRFDPPFDRFSYEWELARVDVPMPVIPADVPPEIVMEVERSFHDYMGKLTVRIFWSRAGVERDATGETLLRTELLWQPPEEFF